jgi:bifunctional DNA-binding transcriptional regulator/antitoxin component of YhaV-PrlF toxin-antitoxin module
MRLTKISQGGQIQVPAEVRRRWATRDVVIEDLGSSLSIRPLPDDPIGAAAGSLAGPGPTGDEMRRQWREEELEAERRKQLRLFSTLRRSSRS